MLFWHILLPSAVCNNTLTPISMFSPQALIQTFYSHTNFFNNLKMFCVEGKANATNRLCPRTTDIITLPFLVAFSARVTSTVSLFLRPK